MSMCVEEGGWVGKVYMCVCVVGREGGGGCVLTLPALARTHMPSLALPLPLLTLALPLPPLARPCPHLHALASPHLAPPTQSPDPDLAPWPWPWPTTPNPQTPNPKPLPLTPNPQTPNPCP